MPVAAARIDNSTNAVLLAVRILRSFDVGAQTKVEECWNTAVVARLQSSSPYTGKADVLDCQGCRSKLPSVLDHGDLGSRLSISLGIVGVFGSIEFSRMCIYIGPAAVRLTIIKQLKQFNLFYAAHITILLVIFIILPKLSTYQVSIASIPRLFV